MVQDIAINGDNAVALAWRQIDPDVCAAYPITPQTIIVEKFAEYGVTPAQIERTLADCAAGDWLVLQNEISEIPYIIERAAARGMRVILNPSPFPENWREWPMEAVSFFVVNEIEGALLTGEERPERILAAMRRQFPAARTLLTLGSRGAAFDDGETVYFAGCVDVPVADTTGAGDTFLGYFFSGLEQRGAERALHLASAAAALAVSVKGAANSIPALEQTLAFAAARGLTV
jgi:ribokinase